MEEKYSKEGETEVLFTRKDIATMLNGDKIKGFNLKANFGMVEE